MNLSWEGRWLSVDRNDSQEVIDKLGEAGIVVNVDFKTYYPRRVSIVAGKTILADKECLILFCGSDGNEVLAKMILE